jgi:hypothetical protein
MWLHFPFGENVSAALEVNLTSSATQPRGMILIKTVTAYSSNCTFPFGENVSAALRLKSMNSATQPRGMILITMVIAFSASCTV